MPGNTAVANDAGEVQENSPAATAAESNIQFSHRFGVGATMAACGIPAICLECLGRSIHADEVLELIEEFLTHPHGRPDSQGNLRATFNLS